MDDIVNSLSSIEHVIRTQARQAVTGSRGSIVDAVSSNMTLFTTSMAMRFSEEARVYDQTVVSKILDILQRARSIEELSSVLPVSVGCTRNQQFESIFRYSSNPVRLNNQLLDAIDKNIRLLLPTRSTISRQVSSSSSNSNMAPTFDEDTVPNTPRSILAQSNPDPVDVDGLEGKNGNEITEHKQASIQVDRHRRIVTPYLNKAFSGGTVDDVVAKLESSCPNARVCEDITEISERMGLKFSKEGKDSSIVFILGVFPNLPIPKKEVKFAPIGPPSARWGFSLDCIDPATGRIAVINSDIDKIRTKYGAPLSRGQLRYSHMTNVTPTYCDKKSEYVDSATDVVCFAEWFCKNVTFDPKEFSSRVKNMKKKDTGKTTNKKRRSKKRKRSNPNSILKQCNLLPSDDDSGTSDDSDSGTSDDSDSSGFSAGQGK